MNAFQYAQSHFLSSLTVPQHPYREFYDSHEVRTASVQRRLDQGVFRTMGFAPEWDLENRGWKK